MIEKEVVKKVEGILKDNKRCEIILTDESLVDIEWKENKDFGEYRCSDLLRNYSEVSEMVKDLHVELKKEGVTFVGVRE